MKCNIKWLITKSGKTQKEVAELINISPQQLNAWATMKAYPRIDRAIELCEIIGCTLNDLYEK